MTEQDPINECAAELIQALAAADRDGRRDPLADELFQDLFAAMVKAYSARAQGREPGEDPLPPFRSGSPVTATDVVITASAMLREQEIAAFELAMWHY